MPANSLNKTPRTATEDFTMLFRNSKIKKINGFFTYFFRILRALSGTSLTGVSFIRCQLYPVSAFIAKVIPLYPVSALSGVSLPSLTTLSGVSFIQNWNVMSNPKPRFRRTITMSWWWLAGNTQKSSRLLRFAKSVADFLK